jgi:hypothetical protein
MFSLRYFSKTGLVTALPVLICKQAPFSFQGSCRTKMPRCILSWFSDFQNGVRAIKHLLPGGHWLTGSLNRTSSCVHASIAHQDAEKTLMDG